MRDDDWIEVRRRHREGARRLQDSKSHVNLELSASQNPHFIAVKRPLKYIVAVVIGSQNLARKQRITHVRGARGPVWMAQPPTFTATFTVTLPQS